MRFLLAFLVSFVSTAVLAGPAYEYDTTGGGLSVYAYDSGGGGYDTFPFTHIVWWHEVTDGTSSDNIAPFGVHSIAGDDWTWFYLGIDGGSRFDRIDYHVENTGGPGAACGSYEGWLADSGSNFWALTGMWAADASHPTLPGDCGGFIIRQDTEDSRAKTTNDTLDGGFDNQETIGIGNFQGSVTPLAWDVNQMGYLDGFAVWSVVLTDDHRTELLNGLPAMFVDSSNFQDAWYAGLGGGVYRDAGKNDVNFDTTLNVTATTDPMGPPYFWPMGGN